MTPIQQVQQEEARRIAGLPTFTDRRAAIRAFLITHPEVDANEFYVTYFFFKKEVGGPPHG